MPTAAFVLLALLLLPSRGYAQAPACSGHLVTIGPDGAVLNGTKQALSDAVRSGSAVRVGWSLDSNKDGQPELTHWADAMFLTEWQGEVFAQLSDIQRQTPRADSARVEMPAGRQRWSGLIGTTGVLAGHFDTGDAPPDVRVRSTWCLASCPPPAWRLVYHHDADGTPIAGSKTALFDVIRSGVPIRIAWGASAEGASGPASVEHSAEPVFVTIMNGTEVAVQLPEHIAQASYSDPGKAVFETPSVMWRGLLASDGSFDAVYVDRATGREVRRLPQRARIAWMALISEQPACRPAPLTLAVPGGVRRVP